MIATLTAPKPPPENENPALGSKPGFQIPLGSAHLTRCPKKWQRVLQAFLAGRTLNRFEAERIGDHCLHSTVSKLERKGLVIFRREEKIPGYLGLATHCCRYWLADTSRPRASELLGEIVP